jgi:hypothetical protein
VPGAGHRQSPTFIVHCSRLVHRTLNLRWGETLQILTAWVTLFDANTNVYRPKKEFFSSITKGPKKRMPRAFGNGAEKLSASCFPL